MTSNAAAAILETEPLPEGETQLTLLELVSAVSEMTSNDAEVTEAVLSLLRSGRVRLCGNFKGEPIDFHFVMDSHAHLGQHTGFLILDSSAEGLIRAQDQIGADLTAVSSLESTLVGWQRVRWERPRVVLPRAGMQLDFGGYVKEYAADRLAALVRGLGLNNDWTMSNQKL